MPYGDEVTDEERENGTLLDRGLHLCAYQSSLERGFRFIQRGEPPTASVSHRGTILTTLIAWYNDPDFPPNKPTRPGWDPLFGQTGDVNKDRFMSGVDPAQPQRDTSFTDKFVDPRGGEYFFSPSMQMLKDYIAQ